MGDEAKWKIKQNLGGKSRKCRKVKQRTLLYCTYLSNRIKKEIQLEIYGNNDVTDTALH